MLWRSLKIDNTLLKKAFFDLFLSWNPPCVNLLALLTPRYKIVCIVTKQRAPPSSKLHLAYLPYLEESISKLLWLCSKWPFVYYKPFLKLLLKLCVTSFFEPVPFRNFDSIFKVLPWFQILPYKHWPANIGVKIVQKKTCFWQKQSSVMHLEHPYTFKRQAATVVSSVG